MNIKQIQDARELYGIEGWGAGYFGISDTGNVVCYPTGEEHLSVDLHEAVEACKKKGVRAPLILRFPQIIECQLERLHEAFKHAIAESKYSGKHLGVFPFKVNQRREFIDHIVEAGKKYEYGLEVGSKTELIAAMSYRLSKKALLICNGFKDAEFIELGFIAAGMGKKVVMVVEGPDELEMILNQAKTHTQCPAIGLRVRLYSKGSGKWEKSSGETSKFGLTPSEVIHCLQILSDAKLEKNLAMLHFHVGSQVTEIKRITNAIKEAARVYAKVFKMGYKPTYLNIGGGVGVDYDGSKTSFQSSANYSLQEFANDAVYMIREVCENEDVPCPDIVTESGRVIAAYHSVVVTNIREVQGEQNFSLDELGFSPDEKFHQKGLKELKYILDNVNRKNHVEYYHDAIEYHEELFTLFNLGYLSLKELAVADELYQRICKRALYFSSFERHQLEEFEDLQQLMVSKYLANFSIFQSIPDAWSIDQLFPVMPLSRHAEKPTLKATIVDITCDSDGCLDKFVDRKDVKNLIDLHPPDHEPYYIGFFLTGAYQESLANEHNLFGAIHEAEIVLKPNGQWEIAKITQGDPIDELLISRNYDYKQMIQNYTELFQEAESQKVVKKAESQKMLKRLKDHMKGYPYLAERTPSSPSE